MSLISFQVIMSNILYKAGSDRFFGQLLRGICILAIGYLAFHYKENPFAIIILSSICLLIFMLIGGDEISVYRDKIIQRKTSILFRLLRFRGKTHALKDVKSAYLKLPPDEKPDLVGIGFTVLFSLLSSGRGGSKSRRPLYLELKNGKMIAFQSSLDEDKMKKIVDLINDLIKTA